MNKGTQGDNFLVHSFLFPICSIMSTGHSGTQGSKKILQIISFPQNNQTLSIHRNILRNSEISKFHGDSVYSGTLPEKTEGWGPILQDVQSGEDVSNFETRVRVVSQFFDLPYQFRLVILF